jgi:hypothetical protein
MPVKIRDFTEDWQQPVREFNSRLARGELWRTFQFPEQPPRLLHRESSGVYEEYVLATENQDVRGAYILKHQMFSFFSDLRSVAHYRLPLSEGVVNRTYAAVGVQMVRDALARQPLLFALGMGTLEKPLPRMLKMLGWKLTYVPFFFKVNRAARFLRNISAIRTSPVRKFLLDFAAFSGGGALALSSMQVLRRSFTAPADARVEVVSRFGDWSTAVWTQGKNAYAMAAVRDQDFLNCWYPPEDQRLIRLKISRRGRELGWALVLDTQMSGDRYFGDMRVGSIADSFAAPDDADAVVACAAGFLEKRGVDLLVANQAHTVWQQAFRRSGFLDGPSNFIFAASPKLAGRMGPLEEGAGHAYLNRGDGDGPIHL